MRSRIGPVGVEGRVVGDEKRAPVEEEAACERAAADDARGVRRVAELGAGLAQIDGTRLDVAQRGSGREPGWRRHEAPAPLVRACGPAPIERRAQRVELAV